MHTCVERYETLSLLYQPQFFFLPFFVVPHDAPIMNPKNPLTDTLWIKFNLLPIHLIERLRVSLECNTAEAKKGLV